MPIYPVTDALCTCCSCPCSIGRISAPSTGGAVNKLFRCGRGEINTNSVPSNHFLHRLLPSSPLCIYTSLEPRN